MTLRGMGVVVGGIAESHGGIADAINWWGTILPCGEIFSRSPKGNLGIEGG